MHLQTSNILHECSRQKCGYSVKGEIRKHEKLSMKAFDSLATYVNNKQP